MPGLIAALTWRWIYDEANGVLNLSLVLSGLSGELIYWLSDPAIASRVRLVSIPIDPEFDTPAILEAHAGTVARIDGRLPDNWDFVTGDPALVRKVAESYGLVYGKEDGQIVRDFVFIDDVVAAANTDVTTIDFDTLTINSHRALRDTNILASEFYVNDNDGLNETGETVLPDNVNTVGNLGVGALNGLDLLDVRLNTFGISVVGDGSLGDGAALSVGTITYGYAPSLGDPATETALALVRRLLALTPEEA